MASLACVLLRTQVGVSLNLSVSVACCTLAFLYVLLVVKEPLDVGKTKAEDGGSTRGRVATVLSRHVLVKKAVLAGARRREVASI